MYVPDGPGLHEHESEVLKENFGLPIGLSNEHDCLHPEQT
jgi:hypothetical protein